VPVRIAGGRRPKAGYSHTILSKLQNYSTPVQNEYIDNTLASYEFTRIGLAPNVYLIGNFIKLAREFVRIHEHLFVIRID